jgi:hypothetical protein
MRSPWTDGIGVGRETCARSDLRKIVTYSPIFTVLGLQLLLSRGSFCFVFDD